MKNQSLDFKELNNALLNHLHSLIVDYVPGGKFTGKEYRAESINGGQGDSFGFNVMTGAWADFAESNHKGGDIISLVAAIKNISQIDAAKELSQKIGYAPHKNTRLLLPPKIHPKHGEAVGYWIYKDAQGYPTHVTMRFNQADGKKTFSQWHYSFEQEKWVPRTTPETPLYNLNLITSELDKKIVICEGEKAADAAAQILSSKNYIATCWVGGSSAVKKVQLSVLKDRQVLLWPDNDEPGIKCMSEIEKMILPIASVVSKINYKSDDEPKMDAYDLFVVPEIDSLSWLSARAEKRKPLPLINNSASTLAETKTSGSLSEKRVIAEVMSQPIPNVDATISSVRIESNELSETDYAYMYDKWSRCGLSMKAGKTMVPFETEDNVIRILLNAPEFQDKFYFDEFYNAYYTMLSGNPEPVGELSVIRLKVHLQRFYGFNKISTSNVREGLSMYLSAHAKKRNTMKEKYSEYEWDGTPRIDAFFMDYYGADDKEFVRDAGRILWLSIMRRILNPGVKMDTVIILEGAQGIRKSTSLEIIADGKYTTAGMDITNKDFFLKLQGHVVVEIGELNAFSKADQNQLKEIISTATDKFRIPYGKEVGSYPRSCVFVGTTNKSDYLMDDTGARRFLPIECKKQIDTDLLKSNLYQLYAEAYVRANGPEDHWTYNKDEHAEIASLKEIEYTDPWIDLVDEFVHDVQELTIANILIHGIGIADPKFLNKISTNRVGRILRDLGFTFRVTKLKNRKTIKLWFRADPDVYYKYQTCYDKIAAQRPILPPPTQQQSYTSWVR